MIDAMKAEIEVRGIELIALKKLSLVSHALAEKIGGSVGREQTALATVLDNVIHQIEINAAKTAAGRRR
jgi:hypothetical protein